MEPDSSLSNLLISATEMRKRVRFSDTDLLATYYEETMSMLSHDDRHPPPAGQKSWKVRERRSQASLETDFRGRYISIQPADELVFEERGEDGDKDSSDMIRLVNISSGYVAFKVKTTAPEKFKVKPSYGYIEPGGAKRVEVSIQLSRQTTAQKDRFLVMSMPLEEEPENPTDVLDAWLESLKEGAVSPFVDERKLKCTVISAPSEMAVVNKGVEKGVMEKMDILNSKLDSLLVLQSDIHTKRSDNQRAILFVVCIFLAVVFLGRLFVAVFGHAGESLVVPVAPT